MHMFTLAYSNLTEESQKRYLSLLRFIPKSVQKSWAKIVIWSLTRFSSIVFSARNIVIKWGSHSLITAEWTDIETSHPMLIKIKLKYFLHDRPWISPWMKSISNVLDITIHVIASQLSGHCDVISNRLWRHQQNENRASEKRGRCVKIVILSSFMDSFCRVRNKIIYVLSWRTVSALTRVLFRYIVPSLRRNSGNKHQNNPLVSAETVRHSSTYIIVYISMNERLHYKHYVCATTIISSWQHSNITRMTN